MSLTEKNINDNINKIHENTIGSWYTFEKPKEIFFVLLYMKSGSSNFVKKV